MAQKTRINQKGGKTLYISHSTFRKILYVLGIINQYKKIDYLILIKTKKNKDDR